MTKIFFLLYSMNRGGVERSLINLLTTIPKDKYEIHVGLLRMMGELLDEFPKNIQVHHIDCFEKYWEIFNSPPLAVIKNLFKKGKILIALVYLLFYIQYKLNGNRYYFFKWIMRNTPMSSEIYDVAIAFAGPSEMIDFYICDKIKAEVKVGWVHFDVSKFGIDKGMVRRLYDNYEKVFVVSQTAKEHFDKVFPQFKDKTEVRYNVIPREQIREMADVFEPYQDGFKGKRILTVGRLSKEKGQDVAIRALKILRERGYDVKWYFVGDGTLMESCKQLSSELGLSEYVSFEGMQKNPYPWMKGCDIYVQPSRHEGYCITLAEAKIFTAPIVATCFAGAHEQLGDQTNAVVIGMTAKEMAEGIVKVIFLNKVA